MKKYRSNTDYVMRNIGGDMLLIRIVNPDCGNTNVYVLNEAGAFLWEELSAEKDKTQLVNLLRDKYSIEQIQAESDVEVFLNKCISEGFISEIEEGV